MMNDESPLRNGEADDDAEDYDYDDDADDDECSAEDDEEIISRTTVEIIVTTSFQKDRMQENTVSLIMSLIKKGWDSFFRGNPSYRALIGSEMPRCCDGDHLSAGETRIIQNFQLTTYSGREIGSHFRIEKVSESGLV